MLLKPQPQFVVYWVVQAKGVQKTVLSFELLWCLHSSKFELQKLTKLHKENQSNSKESTDFWTLLACTTQYTTNWGWGFSNIKISWFIQSNERVNLNKYFPGQIYFFVPLNKSW